MYACELRGEPYNKTEHRKQLIKQLNGRSGPSIEFKHRNISAILIELGYPYIQGYRPAYNYQKLLYETVAARLGTEGEQIIEHVSRFTESVPELMQAPDWQDVLDEAPEVVSKENPERIREFTPVKYNYQERENRNRKLGELGEQFVIDYEKFRLQQAGRTDLAKEVEWTSKEQGDGAGYDVRSFNEARDEELFIEVKTTNSGKYQPFLISDNEVEFSGHRADRYSLYRVFNFRSSPKLFILPGNIKNHVNLVAKQYRASF